MNYEIIATLGPASNSPQTWQEMLSAGATGFRLNTSHLSLAELVGWLAQLDAFFSDIAARVPVTLDLKGSKWRLGRFPDFTLIEGQRVMLTLADETVLPGCLPVPHVDFFAALGQSDGQIVLNDAKIRLALLSTDEASATAQVIAGGQIAARKGITLPETSFRVERLSETDRAIFERAASFAGVHFAISYLRDAAELALYRRQMPAPAFLIAKLERGLAVAQTAQIARHCDALWLCRGDLGAELGLPGMAAAAAKVIRGAMKLPKPLYLAGQVLEHMTTQPTPTRSEVSCIYDALAAGCRGVVLSDETAVGQYPVEAVAAAAMFRR